MFRKLSHWGRLALCCLLFSPVAFAETRAEVEKELREGSPVPQYSLDYLGYLIDRAEAGGEKPADWFATALLSGALRFAERERLPEASPGDIARAEAFAVQGFVRLHLAGYVRGLRAGDFPHVLALARQLRNPSAQRTLMTWLIGNAATRENFFQILDVQMEDALEYPHQNPLGSLCLRVLQAARVRLREEQAVLLVAYVERLLGQDAKVNEKIEILFSQLSDLIGAEGTPDNYARMLERAMRLLIPRVQPGSATSEARRLAVSEATTILLNVIVMNRWYPMSAPALTEMFNILQPGGTTDPFLRAAAERWLTTSTSEAVERMISHMAQGGATNANEVLRCLTFIYSVGKPTPPAATPPN